jgi:hypothetical protein
MDDANHRLPAKHTRLHCSLLHIDHAYDMQDRSFRHTQQKSKYGDCDEVGVLRQFAHRGILPSGLPTDNDPANDWLATAFKIEYA